MISTQTTIRLPIIEYRILGISKHFKANQSPHSWTINETRKQRSFGGNTSSEIHERDSRESRSRVATPSEIGSSEVIKFFQGGGGWSPSGGVGARITERRVQRRAVPCEYNRLDKISPFHEKLNCYHELQPAKADACGFVARAGLWQNYRSCYHWSNSNFSSAFLPHPRSQPLSPHPKFQPDSRFTLIFVRETQPRGFVTRRGVQSASPAYRIALFR